MSTCPDSDLYSAWVDGEVPSPWKEKLEAHLASCPRCKARSERFRNMHAYFAAGIAQEPKPDFDAAYGRLCERRKAFVATVGSKRENKMPEWVHFSVRMPLAAFAALFLAAIFLPALFVLKTSSNLRNQHEEFSLMRQDLQNLKALASQTQVYSPDLSSKSIPASTVSTSGSSIFKTVDYARQFAGDQDLFSNTDTNIIIIKLPKLARFSNSDELFRDSGSNEPLLRAVGY